MALLLTPAPAPRLVPEPVPDKADDAGDEAAVDEAVVEEVTALLERSLPTVAEAVPGETEARAELLLLSLPPLPVAVVVVMAGFESGTAVLVLGASCDDDWTEAVPVTSLCGPVAEASCDEAELTWQKLMNCEKVSLSHVSAFNDAWLEPPVTHSLQAS